MAIRRFEDIYGWKLAKEIAVEIYKAFRGNNDYAFTNQICRAAVSISNNIAEGFDRGTNKEFIRFLNIARSSNNELKSMLYLAEELTYINSDIAQKLRELCKKESIVFLRLIQSMNKQKKLQQQDKTPLVH